MREAQLRKDIVLFMSVYSLTYPELDEKRASTLKAWERFDFTNLVFTVDKIQPIDSDNAIAVGHLVHGHQEPANPGSVQQFPDLPGAVRQRAGQMAHPLPGRS